MATTRIASVRGLGTVTERAGSVSDFPFLVGDDLKTEP
jgi:hypothetical protein